MSRPLKPELDVFDAIANPVRREMIAMLRKSDMPATAFMDNFDISQPALSRHLQVLREAGVVRQQKKGRQRLYKLNITALREIERWIKSQLK